MPLMVLASPIPIDHELALTASEPIALLIVTDPENCSAVLGRHLMDAFGLTPTKAVMVTALAAGKSLAAYAAEAGISKETARWRLKQSTSLRRPAFGVNRT